MLKKSALLFVSNLLTNLWRRQNDIIEINPVSADSFTPLLCTMLESLQEPVLTPLWPVPSDYSFILSVCWLELVIARHTEWRNSPITQDLEQALEEFVFFYPLFRPSLISG